MKFKQSKGFCFSKDTKVLLRNGEEKRIEDVKVGDVIASYNSKIGDVEFCKVDKIISSPHSVINKIYFKNETELISTPDHPYFVVNKGYCSVNPYFAMENYNMDVKELVVGDKCLYYNKGNLQKVEIAKIGTFIEEETEMYVISGGVNNNFFANRILVSDENIMSLDLELNDAELEDSIMA